MWRRQLFATVIQPAAQATSKPASVAQWMRTGETKSHMTIEITPLGPRLMKNLNKKRLVYVTAVGAALVLALPMARIMTVEGQGGDPRNAAPPATSKKPTNRPSKADVIKARVIEVIDLCKTGKNSKAASYFDDQLEVDGECVNIKEETQNGYYFGKFKTATAKDGREAFGWEVYYRGVTLPNGEISYPRNKGDVWYFLFVNGKYVLADFDDIERQEMSRPEATTLLNDVKPQNPNIELVRIRSGSFIMGSTDGESSEQPAHKIVINYSFYMGKHEVTQAQWQKVMGNNPSKFKDCDNCPVEQVSW